VLITGVAGLIGSRLAKWIVENTDAEVFGIDDLSGGYAENIPPGVTWHHRDLVHPRTDLNWLFDLVGPDYVFHFAAYAAEGLSPFMRCHNYRQNLIPAAKLITASIRHKVKRLVFASSMAVYGVGLPPFDETHDPKPIDPYGIAKWAIEQDLAAARAQHGLDYCVIRPHNVYGPHQNIWDLYRNVLGIWVRQVIKGLPLTIYGDGKQVRQFTYVDDIVEPLWRAAVSKEASCQTVNLGGPRHMSIGEAAGVLCDVAGYRAAIAYLPARHEVREAFCTYQKSIDLLGYQHKTGFATGLKTMLDWARTQPDRPQKRWIEYELWSPEWITE
jgi:UDP-glucose 4-epimerase